MLHFSTRFFVCVDTMQPSHGSKPHLLKQNPLWKTGLCLFFRLGFHFTSAFLLSRAQSCADRSLRLAAADMDHGLLFLPIFSCDIFPMFSCQFAHGNGDLRPVLRHRKYKTEKCKNFERDGVCPYGPRCR